jgi:signal transduction histidine kinase
MLEQIEHLINGVRNVSNAIAHDLRTPLAELRSRLEELSLTRPSPNETFAEVDAALADVDRVIAIFDALLRLAQIDTGMRRKGFAPLDAATVAAEAVEFYLPAAELKGVALSFHADGPAPTSGDPVLLAQAVSNLIDNALKYCQSGGAITVEIPRNTDQVVEIAVSDNGPGISDAEKAKVVERFYRGDASRGTPGVGLGLSLVDAVAKLHSGSLRFTDNHPGLKVLLTVATPAPAASMISREDFRRDSPIAESRLAALSAACERRDFRRDSPTAESRLAALSAACERRDFRRANESRDRFEPR